ncbi:hypothetical protein PoB_006357800 [Plakobranchus ocellatus]|uniref:Uncharacterized protein n=1 Tax=Plakobranchus ocellatus TaxID=259542 RepID=A0AAV4CZ37_9GAST|nr:hypothetical protein PoB_006357800 [Plakobranchus ocellatus]
MKSCMASIEVYGKHGSSFGYTRMASGCFRSPSSTALLDIETSPQQGDLSFSDPPSGHGTSGGARTPNKRDPADLRDRLLSTVPPRPGLNC